MFPKVRSAQFVKTRRACRATCPKAGAQCSRANISSSHSPRKQKCSSSSSSSSSRIASVSQSVSSRSPLRSHHTPSQSTKDGQLRTAQHPSVDTSTKYSLARATLGVGLLNFASEVGHSVSPSTQGDPWCSCPIQTGGIVIGLLGCIAMVSVLRSHFLFQVVVTICVDT